MYVPGGVGPYYVEFKYEERKQQPTMIPRALAKTKLDMSVIKKLLSSQKEDINELGDQAEDIKDKIRQNQKQKPSAIQKALAKFVLRKAPDLRVNRINKQMAQIDQMVEYMA